MSTLATRLTGIVTGLRAALGLIAPKSHPAEHPVFNLIWNRIGRLATRFERLFAKFQANALPPKRIRPAKPRTPRRAPERLPYRRAWLMGRGVPLNICASQLQDFLARPDLADFLAAAPQAARYLRPLCHLLGVHNPGQPDKPRRPPRLPPPPAPAYQPAATLWPHLYPAPRAFRSSA